MTDSVAQIKKVTTQLISILNPRNREIILRRFGLKSGQKETLESIGQSHGITRERVRQIEETSLAQMRNALTSDAGTRPFVALARQIIESQGGVISEQGLFQLFSGDSKPTAPNASLAFLLALDGTMERTPEDDDVVTFWSVSPEAGKRFRARVAELIASFKVRKSVVPTAELASFSSEPLGPFLSISKRLDKNVFGEIGLSEWPEVKPRGVRDKSFLVLKKEGKPKHFREITQLINAADFSGRKAHVQTVHNELIKDKRFVLVGRGMYGLSEWGFAPGTVKEVIADLLRAKGPQPKDTIIAHVLSARMVKQNTVLLSMQDRRLFKETDQGHLTLNEA